jgi:hypothetical protein
VSPEESRFSAPFKSSFMYCRRHEHERF